ncbi:MAG: AEC family transporter [Rhodospirillales bacterium]|nr:AEC family transporter [Rhodospirillales bacterium]
MSSTLSALAPVFGLIVVGYVLKARGLFGADFWEPAERLTFYFLFPALLVSKIGGAEIAGLRALPMAAAMITATLLMAVALMVVPRFRQGDQGGPRFVALLQGAIRPNTYVGLAAAYALFGTAGLTLAAAAIVAVIPLVNFISIIALLRWTAATHSAKPGWGAALVASLKNPIIIACVLGAFLNFTGFGLPPVVGPILDTLGSAALPLGLMAVGAGLNFEAVHARRSTITQAVVLKLAVMPGLTYAACWAYGVSGVSQTVAVMFAALPVAAGSYVMTRQMGGDGPLMAGIITATTITAGVTLPVVILLAG